MNEQPRWAIIGGGMMGLTLAHRLSAQSQRVTVIESRPALGGLADAWQLDGVTWDRHYHVILLSDSKLRGMLEELGLAEETRWVETKTGFYAGGKFYSMSSAIEFLMFPPLRLIEKFRLGLTIFYASKIRNWKRMEKLLVADWLSRWSGASTFRKMWLPLLRAKLGDAYQRTAASFIWAYISRMYKARRTGLKKEMFGYVRGGYARILARFSDVLQQAGVEIKLEHAVRSVRSGPNGRVEIEYASGESEVFDRVILTTAAPLVSQAVSRTTEEEKQRFSRVEYLGIVCASLLLRRPLRGYYVTNITDEVPFTAVIETSTLWIAASWEATRWSTLPKYVSAGDPRSTCPTSRSKRNSPPRCGRCIPNYSRTTLPPSAFHEFAT